MKKIFIYCGLAFLFLNTTQAQNFKLESAIQNSIEFTHTLNPFERNSILISGNNYHNFGLSHKVLTSELGAPAIPFFSQAVMVPKKGNVSYEIQHDGFYEIENIEITPSKGNLKRNVNPDTIPYTFSEVYNQDAFYPGELSVMSDPYILRDTRGTTVSLYPFQYNPVQKKLRIYNNLRVVVNTNSSQTGTNEIQKINNFKSSVFNDIYNHHYLNPSENPAYTPISEIGSMLIIADSEYVGELTRFVDWKNESGIKTNIVTTTQTGATDTAIKSFVEDYYENNPDLVFVLLAGDSDKVASHTYGSSGWEQLWSDSYYGQIEGGNNDFYPELLVGRLSGDAEEIGVMVSRILEYEKNPMEGVWMKNAIGLGSNEGSGYGDDGEADYQHLRNIRTELQEFGYEDVHEFYQGSQGGGDAAGEPTPTMINNAIDEGIGLFNYTGHGWLDGMSTGNYTSNDVLNLTNNGKYPFVVSVACNNGTFVGETTIGEVFLRATYEQNPAGAIAFAGSSILMAWAPPMQTQDEMTNILTEVYDNHKNITLGGLFYNSQISMMSEYNSNSTAKEVMQTWILFGDPSTVFRYDVTQEITAQHAEIIAENASEFEVTDCSAEGALATLSQNGVILGKANISEGIANIELAESLDPDAALPLLTITKQNHKPYQSEIEMGIMGTVNLALNEIRVYPNPAKDVVNINWNSNQKITQIELRDMTGRLLSNSKLTNNNSNSYQLNISNYPKGNYLLTFVLDGKTFSKKLIMK
ncbi:C25 family cysteine peptidase [Moheibacter sediminis]|uniref:Gingipain R n=1 Tax=Moheibacter sediminis TaxID=1434700 RepID=A0A1W2A2T9_9FLAO|nr:C25 family cysteine peptidase [Moheibacter sediminis]SMC55007.1 gingipain R [Moheibacter sediminis]